MKLTFILSIAAIIFASCTAVLTKQLKQIPAEVALKAEPTATPLNEICREVKYVTLETAPECLIKQVRNFIVAGDMIYVNDAGKECLKFDTEGNFRGRIGTNGRGPQEYLYIDELALSGDKVLIFDSSAGGSLLTYKLSGEFESRSDIEGALKGISSVEFLPDRTMAAFSPDQGIPERKAMLTFASFRDGAGLHILDSVSHPRPITGPTYVFLYFKEGQFVRNGKETRFKCTFNDTIYSVEGKKGKYGLIPQYVFELGPYAALADARERIQKSKVFNPFAEMAQIELRGESDRYIFYSARSEPVYFYDKKAGVVHKWQLLPEGKEELCKENPKFFTPIRIDESGNLLGTMLPGAEVNNPVLIIAQLK